MGMDAYNLLPHLRSLENSKTGTLQGQTGVLYMDQNQHIHRLLTWISLAQSTRGARSILPCKHEPDPSTRRRACPGDHSPASSRKRQLKTRCLTI